MAKKAATKSAKPIIADLFGEPKKPRAAKKAAKRKPKAAPAAEAEQPTAAKPKGQRIIKMIEGVPIPEFPVGLATKQLGIKTPAVLEWYEKNHPAAYKALVETQQY